MPALPCAGADARCHAQKCRPAPSCCPWDTARPGLRRPATLGASGRLPHALVCARAGLRLTWQTLVVMVKPGGTLRPRCAISQRLAPLPPSCGGRRKARGASTQGRRRRSARAERARAACGHGGGMAGCGRPPHGMPSSPAASSPCAHRCGEGGGGGAGRGTVRPAGGNLAGIGGRGAMQARSAAPHSPAALLEHVDALLLRGGGRGEGGNPAAGAKGARRGICSGGGGATALTRRLQGAPHPCRRAAARAAGGRRGAPGAGSASRRPRSWNAEAPHLARAGGGLRLLHQARHGLLGLGQHADHVAVWGLGVGGLGGQSGGRLSRELDLVFR